MNGDFEDFHWYTVRCVFRLNSISQSLYEERMTLWRAETLDEAVLLAEADAAEYAEMVGAENLGLAQAYFLTESESPANSAEVFSLIRESDLGPSDYLNRFFDTGTERQQRT
jgi:hypothetical protein